MAHLPEARRVLAQHRMAAVRLAVLLQAVVPQPGEEAAVAFDKTKETVELILEDFDGIANDRDAVLEWWRGRAIWQRLQFPWP